MEPHWKKESLFQNSVVKAAKDLGWICYHTYNSFRSSPGFPDLVLVKDKVIFAELKMPRGKVTPSQELWAERLEQAGAEYHLWRPGDWDDIIEILSA